MPFCLRGHTFFNSKLCVSLWEMALLHDTSVADFLLIRPNLRLQYVRSEWQSLRCGWHTNCWHRTAFIFQGMYILWWSQISKIKIKINPLMESWELQQHLSSSSTDVLGVTCPYWSPYFWFGLCFLASTSKSAPYFIFYFSFLSYTPCSLCIWPSINLNNNVMSLYKSFIFKPTNRNTKLKFKRADKVSSHHHHHQSLSSSYHCSIKSSSSVKPSTYQIVDKLTWHSQDIKLHNGAEAEIGSEGA